MDTNGTKVIAMISLAVASFVIGMLPAFIKKRNNFHKPLLVSGLLCFGGGVLLATAFLHMLPEARETLPENSELMLCAGFFLVYLIDELVHYFSSSNHHHHHHEASGHSSSGSYGAMEASGLLSNRDNELDEHCTRGAAGHAGLLLALLIHAVLEGLAVGIQDIQSKVLLLVGAIASHKLVMGFCLGVELAAVGRKNIWTHVLFIGTFSIGSAAGIGIGMLVELSQKLWTPAMGVLQALAAGTLVYVTVSEVFPREKTRWQHISRHSGMLQFTFALLGFIVMFLTNKYFGEER